MSIGRSLVWLSLRCSSGSLIEEDLGKCYCCCSYCCVYSLNLFSFPPPIFSFFICVTPGHTPLSQSHLLQLYVRLWRAHVYLHYDLTAPSSFCNILYNPFCQDTLIWLLLLIDWSVVSKLFVPKAHQRASQNLKAHLYSYPCKIASITCVITL